VEYDTQYGVALCRVYALFHPLSSPRLMGITWGIDYDADNIFLTGWDRCGDFELGDTEWPAPGFGTTVTWNTLQTGHAVPVYWFAAYTYGAAGTLDLAPNPTQGGWFGDDTVPAVLDPIADFGRLGFQTVGYTPCPLLLGACCATDGSCTLETEEGCPPPFEWHPQWNSCDPNPCPPPTPVESASWGSIKSIYR